MKPTHTLLLLLLLFAVSNTANSSPDCPATKYRHTGQTCRDLGLESKSAVCRPGDRFAQWCDDTRDGLVRHCDSQIPCDVDDRHHYDDNQARWDGLYVWFRNTWHHCSTLSFGKGGNPRGYCSEGSTNKDCRGRCERSSTYSEPWQFYDPEGQWNGNYVYFRGKWRDCRELRFDYRQNPRGFCRNNRYNPNCSGGCEGFY